MEFTIANLEQIPLNQEAVKSVVNADFLFVDGGNKHVEAVLYAGLMKIGSGIFIHDYQYENEDFDAPTRFSELEEMPSSITRLQLCCLIHVGGFGSRRRQIIVRS